MARRPHVSLRIIPGTVIHLGLCAGGFATADFEDPPTVGYQDTASQGQVVDRGQDVSALIETWDTLVREALPWAASQPPAGGSGEVMDVSHVTWRKSSYTGANGGNCVEVAELPAVVAVRDSKDPDGPRLAFSPQEWRAFVAGVKAGEFGLG